ncbi:MAG: SPOR domain-containing protein [Myxococcales bacterium]|nr:SPOR domain-containing protein [Myxococcales bacterium]MDH3843435.1 SPOR domain-containing protein [Myxococcales bacterium]
MDTAMRDLERIEERSSDDGNRVLVLSGVGLIAAIGIVVAAIAALPNDGEPKVEDPLQTLALTGVPEATEASKGERADPALDPKTLSFPTTLVTETRPEVAAAMAAAAAELAHLDPLTSPPPRSRIAAGLPAAVTAGPDREVVEMAAVRDPLVAATVPDRTTSSPAGREGLYTLQVVSYRDPQEAQVFADALRKRGHAAYVTSGSVEGRGTHWRVRIGPFESRGEAQSYRTTFEHEEGMNTFIVRKRD